VGTNVYARTITMTTALIRLAKVAILIAWHAQIRLRHLAWLATSPIRRGWRTPQRANAFARVIISSLERTRFAKSVSANALSAPEFWQAALPVTKQPNSDNWTQVLLSVIASIIILTTGRTVNAFVRKMKLIILYRMPLSMSPLHGDSDW
jgi:hypothetical protein